KPGNCQNTLANRAGPERFNTLQQFKVPAADLAGDWLENLPASEGVGRRGFADHERLTPGESRWLLQEKLGQTPSAWFDRVAVEQRHRCHQLGSTSMEAHRS